MRVEIILKYIRIQNLYTSIIVIHKLRNRHIFTSICHSKPPFWVFPSVIFIKVNQPTEWIDYAFFVMYYTATLFFAVNLILK